MGFFRKKHQGGIQEFTPLAIIEYVKQAEEVFKRLQDEREKMKHVELTRRVIAELLGRAVVEEEFITTTQLNIIKHEMDHPTHDYGAPNSMWEIYQFCSYSMKELHPSLWMNSHLKAHSFFTKESGIIVPEKVLILSNGEEEAPNQINMFEVPGFIASGDSVGVSNDFDELPDIDAEVDNSLQIIEERLDVSPEIENKSDDDSVSTEKPSGPIEIDNKEDVDEETGEITTGVKTTDYSEFM